MHFTHVTYILYLDLAYSIHGPAIIMSKDVAVLLNHESKVVGIEKISYFSNNKQ
jgi:hypothetical protein